MFHLINNIYFYKCQRADARKKVKRTSKLWKNPIRLIAVRKQNVSWYKPVTLSSDPDKNYSIFYCSAEIHFPHNQTVVFQTKNLSTYNKRVDEIKFI